MNKDYDFGFTIHEEISPEVFVKTIYVDKKAKDMYDAIFPFLDKLRSSSGDIIKWPAATRIQQVNDMIVTLRRIRDDNPEKKSEIRKMTEDEIRFNKDMGTLKI